MPPSTLAWMRWSQWTVVGTATLSRIVCIKLSITVWPRTSWSATRSGLREIWLTPGSTSWFFGVDEVSQEDLVGQRQRSSYFPADNIEVLPHCRVGVGDHERCGIDLHVSFSLAGYGGVIRYVSITRHCRKNGSRNKEDPEAARPRVEKPSLSSPAYRVSPKYS